MYIKQWKTLLNNYIDSINNIIVYLIKFIFNYFINFAIINLLFSLYYPMERVKYSEIIYMIDK